MLSHDRQFEVINECCCNICPASNERCPRTRETKDKNASKDCSGCDFEGVFGRECQDCTRRTFDKKDLFQQFGVRQKKNNINLMRKKDKGLQ